MLSIPNPPSRLFTVDENSAPSVLEVRWNTAEGKPYTGAIRQTAVDYKKVRSKQVAVMGWVGERCPNLVDMGLDASFCRCSGCATEGRRGIWWVDQQARHRWLNRRKADIGSAVDAGSEAASKTSGKTTNNRRKAS